MPDTVTSQQIFSRMWINLIRKFHPSERRTTSYQSLLIRTAVATSSLMGRSIAKLVMSHSTNWLREFAAFKGMSLLALCC